MILRAEAFDGDRQKGLPAPLSMCGIHAAPLRAIPAKSYGARRGIREENHPDNKKRFTFENEVIYKPFNNLLGNMTRALLLSSFAVILASCGQDNNSSIDTELLSTDIHVSVAQQALVLPFVASDAYAHQKLSFSLNRKGDSERAQEALGQFLYDSTDPNKPLELDSLSVVVKTYGWDDVDTHHKPLCPLLTREWARSVCDNPWAAIQQALPAGRFQLVDLRRLQVGNTRGAINCRDDGKPRLPLPQKPREAVMVCEAMVYGGDDDEFHSAVIRIDGDLGALWMVWRYGQNGETAEEMADREGKAIVAFVQYALGQSEDFSALHADMCRLRRPGSNDSPHGADCEHATR
ncbi:hypothetical protein RO575_05740 [Methylomonas sp. MO1]|uniref:hypothetical protein n=1 Tax=Methylomonas sp. MO1 TaxID=3073619 RepID=UPI0028A30451|nr:hypothetical protein [Methylomonas sp. MO1]MDT4289049.1 hypothetical protein [Methylomonas sp. MO1]